ncbi:MAG: plasmid mobilization relaxosome protein MobC [Oscillospiraceae bacterium]|nr:plasmid mobilization relaxosome protein MobC [Oscillospiraceae bacterium]
MKSKKENRITVRLTPEQYESICEKAAEAMMTPSAFLRAAGMRHKIVVIPGIEELTHELKGIGRNLNQLVILAHEGRISRVDLSGVTAALEKIYGKLTELMTMENR